MIHYNLYVFLLSLMLFSCSKKTELEILLEGELPQEENIRSVFFIDYQKSGSELQNLLRSISQNADMHYLIVYNTSKSQNEIGIEYPDIRQLSKIHIKENNPISNVFESTTTGMVHWNRDTSKVTEVSQQNIWVYFSGRN
ncbi:MAG: hypothetical protein LAT68_14815 [Cyclobacteriaceae bacterium]|nr:hypothetical protein [Cyclobacteriaceae bacterium]MCH8517592.1 hypothetical protein [Cyclobacteriaceae bacterium]